MKNSSQSNFPKEYTCLVVLGPTAVGKTAIGVRLADYFNGEVLSADSRQVYRGLDIGSGKDLDDFELPKNNERDKRSIRWHLMDIAELPKEYSVFDYQQDFYMAFSDIVSRGKIPVIVGGTGMYLDCIIRGYNLVRVPTNEVLREKLRGKSLDELASILKDLKAKRGESLHNDTDTEERHRVIRAIEIEVFEQSSQAKAQKATMTSRPDIRPLVIGTTFPRPMLRAGIEKRLHTRLEEGMVDEVLRLHAGTQKASDGTVVKAVAYDRLERLGLEYRFIAQYLQGQFESKEIMEKKLFQAIGQFAKRQETWYRGMQKKGVVIHWLPHDGSKADCDISRRVQYALSIIENS